MGILYAMTIQCQDYDVPTVVSKLCPSYL